MERNKIINVYVNAIYYCKKNQDMDEYMNNNRNYFPKKIKK